jgi:hypothetical protein
MDVSETLPRRGLQQEEDNKHKVARGGNHGPSHALQRAHASCIPGFFIQPCHNLLTLKSCNDLSIICVV